jgi:hypothetical protein
MLLIREILKIPVCIDKETSKLINRLRRVQAACRLYLQSSQKYIANSSDHCIWIYKKRGVNTKTNKQTNFPKILRRVWSQRATTSTYKLTPLLKKLTDPQAVKKFPAIHGTSRFITVFTSACHPYLCWATSLQSKPPTPLLKDPF